MRLKTRIDLSHKGDHRLYYIVPSKIKSMTLYMITKTFRTVLYLLLDDIRDL